MREQGAGQVLRDALAVDRRGLAVSSLLAAMLFIFLVDVGIIAAGLWVAIAVAGGAHG